MIVVGLTGSIAMGKSTVASMFALLGIPIFDADASVREFYSGNTARFVENMFPGVVIDGRVDRDRLTDLLLTDEKALSKLQELVHPAVAKARSEFVEHARLNRRRLVVVDIPLLFETEAQAAVDIFLVVSAPGSIQRSRALAREGMTEDKFLYLVSQQKSDLEKRRRSHFVIDTSETYDKTREQVRHFLRCTLGLERRNGHHA
jgi:dephospho-CoA kinase